MNQRRNNKINSEPHTIHFPTVDTINVKPPKQRCLLATCKCSEEAKDFTNEVWAKGGIGQQR